MSAWIVSKAHIDAMLRFAIQHKVSMYADGRRLDPAAEPDQIGQALVRECVESVRYRYQDDTDETLPGPVDLYWRQPYIYEPRGRMPTLPEALSLVLSYDYQSCEHPSWKRTPAFYFCHDFLEAVAQAALPEREAARWG